MLITNANQFITSDGSKSKAKAQNHEIKTRQRAEAIAGRPLTNNEWNLQRIEPATDSRPAQQSYNDEHFRGYRDSNAGGAV